MFNYDMPDTTDAYTHRIGRTGRVNNTGEAFTLVTGEDKDMIKALEHIFNKPIETRKVDGFNYNAEAPAMDSSMRRQPLRRRTQPAQRQGQDMSASRPRSQSPIRRVRSNGEKSADGYPMRRLRPAHSDNPVRRDRPLSREKINSN
jgi:ATP-dependent RNA helicase RhlE